MWEKIIIPMCRLWLHGLYGLYWPWCPLSPKRQINLIPLSWPWVVNLLWPSNAIIGSGNGLFDGTKPSYEPLFALITKSVLSHSSETVRAILLEGHDLNVFGHYTSKIAATSPRGQWANTSCNVFSLTHWLQSVAASDLLLLVSIRQVKRLPAKWPWNTFMRSPRSRAKIPVGMESLCNGSV